MNARAAAVDSSDGPLTDPDVETTRMAKNEFEYDLFSYQAPDDRPTVDTSGPKEPWPFELATPALTKAKRKQPRHHTSTENNRRYQEKMRSRDVIETPSERTCCSCGETKPADQFSKNRADVSGLSPRCKKCKKAEYHTRYAEKAASYNPVSSKTCGGCGVLKDASEFYKQTAAADGLSYHCIACSKDINRGNYENSREEIIAKNAIYARNHPENTRSGRIASRCNSRAKEAGVEGRISAKQWRDLLDEHNHCCAYCLRPETEERQLTADHMTPMTRWGDNNISNIAPACYKCNGSKGNKTLLEYMSWLSNR